MEDEQFRNIKDALGERAARIATDIVEKKLVEEGASFKRPTGSDGQIFRENGNYLLRFNRKGGVQVFKKSGGLLKDLGDFDDFYYVNDKPIGSEVSAQPAAIFDMEFADRQVLSSQGLRWEEGLTAKIIKRLNAVKDVTGKEPEFIFVVPKGEFRKSKYLPNFLADIKRAGFKYACYMELPVEEPEIHKVAKRIFEEREWEK
ncbi:hypothetical protein HYY74_02275 [Candidatus Woesearchaeota archaeon]|nr:hypothetical protein [Candidatus Woesearchaeota archaeon]